MIEQAVSRLDQLARADATVAPLARLQVEALRESTAGGWDDAVPELDGRHLEGGVPLLDGQTVRVDGERVRRLLLRLAKATAREAVDGAANATSIVRAVEQGHVDLASLLTGAR